MPQSTPWASLRTTMGKQPEARAVMVSGARAASIMSSIAPVPKVIFTPCPTQHWPKSEADWSPTRAKIGGEPSRTDARACAAMVGTIVGIIEGSRPSSSRAFASHEVASSETSP